MKEEDRDLVRTFLFVGLFIFLLVAINFVFGQKYLGTVGDESPAEKQVEVTVGEAENAGELILQMLQKLADTLGLSQGGSPSEIKVILPDDEAAESEEDKASEEEKEKEAEADEEEKGPKIEPRPIHWHMSYEKKLSQSDVEKLLKLLDIRLKYQAERLLFFRATGLQIKRLQEEILLKSKSASPMTNYAAATLLLANKEHDISIFFEPADELVTEQAHLHWHLRFTLNNRVEFSDMLVKMKFIKQIESEELIVMKLLREEIEKLRARVPYVDGILYDFGADVPVPAEDEITLVIHIEAPYTLDVPL